MNNTQKFVDLVKNRSKENIESFNLLYEKGLYGNCVSVLRQELDSYIRVLFINGHTEKDAFISQILSDKKLKDKDKTITDRAMLEYLKPSHMDAWEESYIYQIGCFFVHLSNFHNYKTENPFQNISQADKENIVEFIKDKHSWEADTSNIDINKIESVIPFLPLIIKKISANLECALEKL